MSNMPIGAPGYNNDDTDGSEPVMHLEQRGNSVLCWIENWTGGQATPIYDPVSLVKDVYGDEYADAGKKWLWKQGENAIKVIQLRDYEDGQPFGVAARGYKTVSKTITLHKPTTPDIEEPTKPDRQFVYLDNSYLGITIDLHRGGAVSGLHLKDSNGDDGENLVDDTDNGRLIQCDCGTGKPAVNHELNLWTDIPHREVETPTQGGGWDQRPNYVRNYEATQHYFTCTANLIDYWSVGPNGEWEAVRTKYELNWTVTLTGPRLELRAKITPKPPRHITIWWFAKGFNLFNNKHRWESNPAFQDVRSSALFVNHLQGWVDMTTPQGRILAMWLVDESTGASANVDDRPPNAEIAETGVRVWDSDTAELTLDFSNMFEGAEEPEQPPVVDYEKKNHAALRALLRTLGPENEDGVLTQKGMEVFKRFYEQELE